MISIIIPVYNEAKNIIGLLHYLKSHSYGYITEIIVIDGGSTDGTLALLQKENEITVVASLKGRAKQMNKGATIAKGQVLYFLHADSFPPLHFDKLIVDSLNRNKNVRAGCFMLKFDTGHWWLRLMGMLTAINHMCCRGGDQSLFVGNSLFWQLGGFDEAFIIYEDNDLIKKLYAATNFKVIRKRLVTSARLYDTIGIWKLQWIYVQIYWKKRFGAGPEKLYDHYKRKIVF